MDKTVLKQGVEEFLELVLIISGINALSQLEYREYLSFGNSKTITNG